CRFLLHALMARRVDVKRTTRCGRLRFGARAQRDRSRQTALAITPSDTVGIVQCELHLVFSALDEAEEAAREHVGRRVIERALEDRALAADAEQWQSLPPGRLPFLAIRDRHCRVAIGVALDAPLESGRDER